MQQQRIGASPTPLLSTTRSLPPGLISASLPRVQLEARIFGLQFAGHFRHLPRTVGEPSVTNWAPTDDEFFFRLRKTVSQHMTVGFEQYPQQSAAPETADTFFFNYHLMVKPELFVIRVRQVQWDFSQNTIIWHWRGRIMAQHRTNTYDKMTKQLFVLFFYILCLQLDPPQHADIEAFHIFSLRFAYSLFSPLFTDSSNCSWFRFSAKAQCLFDLLSIWKRTNAGSLSGRSQHLAGRPVISSHQGHLWWDLICTAESLTECY